MSLGDVPVFKGPCTSSEATGIFFDKPRCKRDHLLMKTSNFIFPVSLFPYSFPVVCPLNCSFLRCSPEIFACVFPCISSIVAETLHLHSLFSQASSVCHSLWCFLHSFFFGAHLKGFFVWRCCFVYFPETNPSLVFFLYRKEAKKTKIFWGLMNELKWIIKDSNSVSMKRKPTLCHISSHNDFFSLFLFGAVIVYINIHGLRRQFEKNVKEKIRNTRNRFDW